MHCEWAIRCTWVETFLLQRKTYLQREMYPLHPVFPDHLIRIRHRLLLLIRCQESPDIWYEISRQHPHDETEKRPLYFTLHCVESIEVSNSPKKFYHICLKNFQGDKVLLITYKCFLSLFNNFSRNRMNEITVGFELPATWCQIINPIKIKPWFSTKQNKWNFNNSSCTLF